MENAKRRRAIVAEESPYPLIHLPGAEGAQRSLAFTQPEAPKREREARAPAEDVPSNHVRARVIFALLAIASIVLGFIVLLISVFLLIAYVLLFIGLIAVAFKRNPVLLAQLKKPKPPQPDELKKGDFTEVIDSVFKVDTMLVSQNLSSVIQILINKASFVIGSKEDACDYVLNMDTGISRTHFRIVFAKVGGRTAYYVEDLNSRNGTWLNGEKLEPNQPKMMQPEDTIMVSGKFAFVVRSTSY
ncbi:MAG: FHA domain-containing protein [Clostridia bacterium]|nr:FHA domain-containing protein [Clostridia bacterium]